MTLVEGVMEREETKGNVKGKQEMGKIKQK
jgi:hypothetical protein